MGWNDHLDDDNEIGNFPPEAFGIWNVDGPFDPQDHWLRTAKEDDQLIAIRAWFLARYCDPIHATPYNSREGGYQFINGGPYDPADVIPNRFANVVDNKLIEEIVDELHQQVGAEWVPIPHLFGDEYDIDYDIRIEESDQPLARLRERLQQSKQILTLRGDFLAQVLARNLEFGSVITSLESFLWETAVYWVDHDERAVVNLITKLPYFRDQPMKLGEIFAKKDSLKKEIKTYLQNLVWHQWNKVVPLLELGLGINVPGLKQFDGALKKRHDIVHRSGFSSAGQQVHVDTAEIESLCGQIIAFAIQVNENLANRKAES